MFYAPIRVIHKSIRFSFHIVVALLISLLSPILLGWQWHQTTKGKTMYTWWFSRASKILDLDVHQYGYPQKTTTLFIANHISFLDIIVLAAITPARFLSKETLRYWPIIGFITSRTGTVFIERGNRNVIHKTIHAMGNVLQQEHSLVIFPEGTTTLGNSVNKFNSGIFQAAINTSKPIQPVALRYVRNGKPNRTVAYIDSDNFIVTLIKIMAQTKIEVQLCFCNVIDSEQYTRTELAINSHAIISDIVHK